LASDGRSWRIAKFRPESTAERRANFLTSPPLSALFPRTRPAAATCSHGTLPGHPYPARFPKIQLRFARGGPIFSPHPPAEWFSPNEALASSREAAQRSA
jgi:hypothetical protein